MAKNLKLKAGLVLRFGSQNAFCFHAKIPPAKLSEIVVGKRRPSPMEAKKLRAGLGEEWFRRAFPDQ